MIQIRLVDHEQMKVSCTRLSPANPVELQTIVTAQRLAFDSLPQSTQLQFLHQAAVVELPTTSPSQ